MIKPLVTNVALSCHPRIQPEVFWVLSFPPVRRKHLYLPLRHCCHRRDPVRVIICGLPCIELPLSLLSGVIRKQGPLTEAGLNHPRMGCLLFAQFYFYMHRCAQ